MNQPLGVYISKLIKSYYSMLSKQLDHISIDRYFYPMVVIKKKQQGASQKELAEELGVDKVTMVRILDYLEKHQCISRKADPRDRRVKRIELTGLGENYADEIEQALFEVDQQLLVDMNSKEKRQLLQQLDNMLKQLKDFPLDKVELTLKNKVWQ